MLCVCVCRDKPCSATACTSVDFRTSSLQMVSACVVQEYQSGDAVYTSCEHIFSGERPQLRLYLCNSTTAMCDAYSLAERAAYQLASGNVTAPNKSHACMSCTYVNTFPCSKCSTSRFLLCISDHGMPRRQPAHACIGSWQLSSAVNAQW